MPSPATSRRCARLGAALVAQMPGATPRFFSAPGRTELSGNHTDHSGGRVLAAAIDVDVLAAAVATPEPVARVVSDGFPPLHVDLRDLAPRREERGTPLALLRGVAAGLAARGARLGGFSAWLHSEIPPGAGLSSSAAFEVLLGALWNHLHDGGRLPAELLAEAGRAAEQDYFGKPCGLMDQLTCALGGVVALDFAAPRPRVRRLEVDFAAHGLALVVVHAGDSHAGLEREYAAIPADIAAVAEALGLDSLRGLDEPGLWRELPRLRAHVSDRALLRALHFVTENARVERQIEALARGDLDAYLADMRGSGASSLQWLQNGLAPGAHARQGVALALARSAALLSGERAAWRVHGGGFGGSMQALLPASRATTYCLEMDALLGAGAARLVSLRAAGAGPLTDAC